jgi:hypothetical protein
MHENTGVFGQIKSINLPGEEGNNHFWGLGCCHSIHDIFAREVSSDIEKCSQHA